MDKTDTPERVIVPVTNFSLNFSLSINKHERGDLDRYMLQPCRRLKQGCFETIQQAALLIILQTLSLDIYDKDCLPMYSIIVKKRLLLGYGQPLIHCASVYFAKFHVSSN